MDVLRQNAPPGADAASPTAAAVEAHRAAIRAAAAADPRMAELDRQELRVSLQPFVRPVELGLLAKIHVCKYSMPNVCA